MQVNITNQLHISTETSRVVCIDSNGVKSTVRITQAEINILLFLSEKKGEIVSKNQLIDAGWKGRITGSNSLNVAIYNLRKCLSMDNQVQLENIPRLGYRLNVTEHTMPQAENTNGKEDKSIDQVTSSEWVLINLHSKVAIKIKILILIVLNLFLLKFFFTTYLNLVHVECKKNINGEICYSKNYAKSSQSIDIPAGISIISNNHYSNIKE